MPQVRRGFERTIVSRVIVLCDFDRVLRVGPGRLHPYFDLEARYDSAAIYFPFTDLIVADPYKDIADGLKVAFYIGQSIVVDGTTTDMVAYVTGDVFVQAWIGAEDKLPRRVYAVYLNDRARLRHVLALSN